MMRLLFVGGLIGWLIAVLVADVVSPATAPNLVIQVLVVIAGGLSGVGVAALVREITGLGA